MNEDDFEGTVVLEQLAEFNMVDDFFDVMIQMTSDARF